jgi:CubicO group peptidase (beta-lactamase class C family)
MSFAPGSFRLAWLSAALFVVCAGCSAQETGADAASRIDQLLTKTFPADAPGGAAIAVHRGQVVLRKGYGSANLELGIAMKPDHVFRLGSITKQFTAVAILQLVEAGKLTLDDDITSYVPAVQTAGHTITLRHLLTHTSGLPSFTDQPAWRAAAREDRALERELEFIKDVPPHFAPGTDWAYCNTGYRLLGAVIEKVTGETYANYVAEKIFKPAGMTHASYDETRRVTPLRVPGYSSGGRGGPITNAAYVSMTQPHGAGALMANVDDLRHWHDALLAGKLVGGELLQQAHTSARLADGRETGYGFGWSVTFTAGSRAIEHGGGIQGFSTHALSVPDEQLFAVVLCNSDQPRMGPSVLCTQIAEMILGPVGSVALTVPAEMLDTYVGVYRAPYEKIAFTRDGDQLAVTDQSGRTFALTALSPAQFFAPKIQMRYTFVDDADRPGRKRVRLKPRAKAESFAFPIDEPLRTPAAEVPVATLDRYTGEYELRPNLVLTVNRDGDSLTAQATGQPMTNLMAESQTRFRLKQVPATIDFETDESGAVSGLLLSQDGREIRARRLK